MNKLQCDKNLKSLKLYMVYTFQIKTILVLQQMLIAYSYEKVVIYILYILHIYYV